MLQLHQLIPPLTIHAADGRTVRAWDFKQKKNLVIVFLHNDCPRCEEFLRQLSANASLWKENEAVVLAAVLAQPSRVLTDLLHESVIVGVDPSGRAAAAYLGKDALAPTGLANLGIFQTDRYGELAASWNVTSDHKFPIVADIAASLELTEMSCDACASPIWPAED
jgi:AhpC/TSA family protein